LDAFSQVAGLIDKKWLPKCYGIHEMALVESGGFIGNEHV
jgi:hypothetical protein